MQRTARLPVVLRRPLPTPLLPVGLLVAAGCAAPAASGSGSPPPMDPHSLARPAEARVTHVSLDLELDFENEVLRGSATSHVERAPGAERLVLDTEGLFVAGVRGADGAPRNYRLGARRPPLGAPLEIDLAPGDDRVTVHYHTEGDTEALLWLEPEQTAGGRLPFLFTQGQSILTRAWIPLQDSPGVRITYDAQVRAPEGMTVVMSAESRGRGEDGAFRFGLDQPIPPYLIALACGELSFAPLSERCGVWAEPEVLPAARAEFEDTESMIQSAEELFGPYRWARYDLLILPPAFPFGGMENPLLTFATPTILAGDKSLVALVAHELAHSWSGNLVTNATWRDFWLNEGFTVYLEKRIMEAIFGEERARLEMCLDRDELEEEMADLAPEMEVLHVELGGRHPDEAFSSVPYEKGALFLRRLEELYGRECFDAFLNAYFDAHAFESITTGEFVAYLRRELLEAEPTPAAFEGDPRWPDAWLAEWLEEPGLPDDAPRYESEALERVEATLARWNAGEAPEPSDVEGWVTQQWLHLLRELPHDVSAARLAELDDVFDLTDTENAEIACAWLERAVRHRYRTAYPRLERFLTTVGRRKFLTPLYRRLVATEEGRELARRVYERARPLYHAMARGTLDPIVRPQPATGAGAQR